MAKSVGNQQDTAPPLGADDRQKAVLLRYLKIVSWLGMIFMTFYACTRMVAAGDTWVAMACGRHFLNHGVDTIEPFSANSHAAGPTLAEIQAWPTWAKLMVDVDAAQLGLDAEAVKADVPWIARILLPKFDLETVQYWHPTGWINQNWLTHVFFYAVTTGLGSEEEPFFNALVYWKFAIYLLTVFCIYRIGRELGLYPFIAAMSACFALFIGRSFLDVRPAGFSNLLVAAFILLLILTTHRNVLYIWLIVPLAAFWCNLHGGYIYVFIMLMPFIGQHVLAALPGRWSLPLHASLGWLVLLILSGKLIEHPLLGEMPAASSSTVQFLLVLCAIGIVLAAVPRVKVSALYAYLLVATVLVFFVLLSQFFPRIPQVLNANQLTAVQKHLFKARCQFLGLYALFVYLGVLVSFFKDRLVVLKLKEIGQVIAAGVVSFVAMVILSPFHLTNITHTLEISVSEHAERWRQVHEWHPAFQWTNPVGTAEPFFVLVVMAVLAVFAWHGVHVLVSRLNQPKTIKRRKKPQLPTHEWPRFDLAAAVIAALTIYMAMRSRRFIPIAGFAACPFVFLLIQQVMMGLSALRSHDHTKLRPAEADGDGTLTWWFAAFIAVLPILYGIGYLALGIAQHGIGSLGIAHPVYELMGKVEDFHSFRAYFYALSFFILFSVFLLLGFLSSGSGDVSGSNFRPPPGLRGALLSPPLPLVLFTVVALNVFGFGLCLGYKFKQVYLNAWPPDPHYSSVFMRMTASFYKPFNACKFIRQNKVSGRMMNYWTEGGFIGWGQDADPNTGKTPLQLFMDGRAQAAYDRKAFDQWHQIWGGGPEMARFQLELRRYERGLLKKKPNLKDFYPEMGEWISQVLRNRGVWVALVPQGQFDRPFCRALEHNREWPIVFINNKQKLFVDATTEKGKALFSGIGTGQTVYPDEFTQSLNLGRFHLIYDRSEGAKKKGLDYLIKAYELNPTPAPVIEVLGLAAQFTPLHTEVTTFCQQIVDDFDAQKDVFIKQDGYRGRLEAARMSCGFLARLAKQRKNTVEAAKYTQRAKEISVERDWQGARTRW
ncbi:MAG: hypothetical protein IH892_15540 [Planctomycetes bacterium]|nr:hypothetical protein [Planctomycetota bacterium]